jgi:hypothetical protein
MSEHPAHPPGGVPTSPSRRRRLLTRALPLGAFLIGVGVLVTLKVRGGSRGD